MSGTLSFLKKGCFVANLLNSVTNFHDGDIYKLFFRYLTVEHFITSQGTSSPQHTVWEILSRKVGS